MFAKAFLLIVASFTVLPPLIGLLSETFHPDSARQECLSCASVQAAIIPVTPLPQEPRPLPQDPNPVSIQTAGAKALVIVTVDKSRVRVNEVVRFKLSPASLVTNPKLSVTVDFGDGTRIETRQTSVTHRYGATGHYKVYASVVSPGFDSGPQDTRPRRPVPRVTLTAQPSSVVARNPVNFTAQLTSNYPGIKYRFVFGDGSQTDWQEAPYTSHAYAQGGTYLAYVDLGLGDGRGIKQVGGSLRQPIAVTDRPKPPPDTGPPIIPPDRLPGPVQLTANPSPVQTGKTVTFIARVDSTNPNIRYRFVFGDGSSSGWQASSQATHAYAAQRNYMSVVNMGLETNGAIRRLSSARQGIVVTASPPVEVDFAANPIPVEKGQPITFDAKASSQEPNLRYRFVFGDGPSPSAWQPGTQASYTYSAAGDYAAHVELGRETSGRVTPLAKSSIKTISVTSSAVAAASPKPSETGSPTGSPTSSTSPTDSNGGTTGGPIASPSNIAVQPSSGKLFENWWVYLLILLLLLFVAYQIYRALFVPRATLHPNPDPGGSEVDAGAKGLTITSQVLLSPNLSRGQYLVHANEGNIVRSVRRENV